MKAIFDFKQNEQYEQWIRSLPLLCSVDIAEADKDAQIETISLFEEEVWLDGPLYPDEIIDSIIETAGTAIATVVTIRNLDKIVVDRLIVDVTFVDNDTYKLEGSLLIVVD